MHPDQLDLERVEQDLKSTHQPTRYAAVHRMRTWIRLSPACHPDALRIFRQVLSNPQDGGTVNAALSGLEELNYKSDAQNVRLYLLNSPHPDVVRTALPRRPMRTPAYQPALKTHPPRRANRAGPIAVQDAHASKLSLPVILPLIANPTLRPHIADALGDLADLDAIPHLEKLLNDSTESLGNRQPRPHAPRPRPRRRIHPEIQNAHSPS